MDDCRNLFSCTSKVQRGEYAIKCVIICTMKASLVKIETLAHQTNTFWLQPEVPLKYLPGQFVEVRLIGATTKNLAAKDRKRWFTLSSSPTEELIAITTKYNAKSSLFKTHLWELTVGSKVEISQPMGDFVLPRNPKKQLLFVAGGIGITPMRSMITWLKDTAQQRHITCIYAVRGHDHAIFKDLLESYCADVTLLNADEGSHLTSGIISEKIATMNQPTIYISGPETMVAEMVTELGATHDQRRVLTDYFPGYEKF